MHELKQRRTIRPSLLSEFSANFGHGIMRRQSQLAMRAAKADAELAYRARGEFLANMNHELRTPLNAIIGFTQMIRDSKAFGLTEDQNTEYCDYILQSADLLLTHINTILELAAVESGGAKQSRRITSPEEIMDAVMAAMMPLAEAAEIPLELRMEKGLPEIHVDPEMIEKALRHLIENAIQYSPDGKSVTLHVRKSVKQENGARVYFAVEDRGPGMSDDVLQRAMLAFEQVHQGLDRKFEGTGLGLPIARSFVELNGGQFVVRSEPGRGTIIRFSFPEIIHKYQEEEQPLQAAG